MGCLRLTYCKIEPTLKVAYKNLKISSKSCAGNYRYGFQGQETDDEIKGEGNSVNYKYRMHDPRIGRFFAIDPLAAKYPWYTPYQFSGNKPIQFVELEGLEEADPNAASKEQTNSTVNQMNMYRQYERKKFENPGLPEAFPLGDPLQDYMLLDKSRTIDYTRNPQKMWIPGCLQTPGVFCTYYQYGGWETTVQSFSETSKPVTSVSAGAPVFGPLVPIGPPIVNAFVADSPLTAPAFNGAMTSAINTAIAAPAPMPIMGTLPIGPGTPGPVITVSNTTIVDGLTTVNTLVTQQNFVRTVNSTVFNNSISFNVNSAAAPNAATIGFMNIREATIRSTFNNPFVPIVLNRLTYNSPISPNSVQLFNTVMSTNFTSTWTTTVTTTIVTTTTFNFMRNENDYIGIGR